MDNNEDYVKQQINALIHVQDNLCPELFSASQKLRPEVREVILNIVEFAGELVRETFKQVKLKDVLICGSCAGYLYLQQAKSTWFCYGKCPRHCSRPKILRKN